MFRKSFHSSFAAEIEITQKISSNEQIYLASPEYEPLTAENLFDFPPQEQHPNAKIELAKANPFE